MNELIDGWLEHKARCRVVKARPLTFNQFLIYVKWAKAARC